jgi:thioredoxin-related protein
MLSGGELARLYSSDFVVFVAEPIARNAGEPEARTLPEVRYIPNFVFLDSEGKKVLETPGFGNVREAKAVHEYVSKRHYLKTSYRDFLAAFLDR